MEFDHAEVDEINYSRGTVTVAPTSVTHTYQLVNGEDVLGLLVDTSTLGPFLIAITPDTAQHIAATLDAMVADIPRLRAEYQAREAGQ